MEKLRLYDFDSIGDYDTKKLGLGDAYYYHFEINETYYKESGDVRPRQYLHGVKNEPLLKQPIMLQTNDIEDEHQLDSSLTDEQKASFHKPDLWLMPIMDKMHRAWIVRDDLCEAICNAITIGEYELYDVEIFNSHLQKKFTNYKIIHFINIEPNMERSEYELNTKYFKVPMPEFTKMVFDKSDFNEFIAYEYLFGGPFVTEAFKTKLENFSKELCFDYQDFEASELNLDIYC